MSILARIATLSASTALLLALTACGGSSPKAQVNQAPVIQSLTLLQGTAPAGTYRVGGIYYFEPKAADPEGDAFTYSLGGQCSKGASIVKKTYVEFRPAEPGTATLEVLATDAAGAVSKPYAIQVVVQKGGDLEGGPAGAREEGAF